jgi:hypothetical protein
MLTHFLVSDSILYILVKELISVTMLGTSRMLMAMRLPGGHRPDSEV